MFERVVLNSDGLDAGALAEALVYYGHVEAFCLEGELIQLVKQLGVQGAIRLAESELVTLSYRQSVDAVQSDDGSLYPHAFFSVHALTRADGRRIRGPEDEIEYAFESHFGRGVIRRGDLRRLISALEVRQDPPAFVGKAAEADVADPRALTAGIQAVLRAKLPSYPNIDGVLARAHFSGWQFSVETNIRFDLAARLAQDAGFEPLTISALLAPIIGVRTQMHYAGARMTDLWVDEVHSALLRVRVSSFINRLEGGRQNIDRFEEKVFGGRSFAQAVESGERSLIDVLQFAEEQQTRKFKEWMRDSRDGADLLAEYERSRITPSKFASSLPVKATKLVMFSSVGALLEQLASGTGFAAAVVGNVVSDFILNDMDRKILSQLQLGWRPNQWVSKSAKPFLNT